ncbi:hypothetical protein V1639_17265 [Pseudarthrobacter sp. J75]|uniref:hypothetical protein n=1 Tax=unclassified Pseudarthrobacter TaxID=2647000 RepID=UPI002E81167F|nr:MULTISPECIES: hypothetical protein [unclassified Pseudarthrobacter]MEE2522618.1 hypothetical protein [Pseudarthrobacter sp. J47]MEE2530760.1 hypothetical protein [Pseudarthrobacter sp. J75]MEE2571037.1 hypothetical protein [Pseudarthrobacter sp. J64]
MRRAPLPEHLIQGSFSLRASDKAGVSRTRTAARDLATVSRGIRMYLGSEATGAAALRAYTDLDDASVLSFGSAARLFGVPLPGWAEEDWRVHVARRRGFSMPRRANVVGHLLTLQPDEVVEFDGVRLTSPARTWLDLASILRPDDLTAVGDSLVCEHGPDFPKPRQALCSAEDLAAMVARHPGTRGIRSARAALEDIRVGSDSQQETRMRLTLVRAGLPEPELNYALRDPNGRAVVWPDGAYTAQRISIQYEGVHHADGEQHLRDIRRADLTTALGWLEVRVSKFDLQGERPAVVSKVRAALQSRGWCTR